MNSNPLIPQPPDPALAAKVLLTLIREDLKSRRFFEGLREIGLDDNFYQPDLVGLIMAGVGLDIENSHHYDFCIHLFRKHSARVVEDHDLLLHEAGQVYHHLIQYAMRPEQVGW